MLSLSKQSNVWSFSPRFFLRGWAPVLTVLLALCLLSVPGGGAAGAAALSLVNEITAKHTEVPGTGAFFLVPEGLAPSKQFDGFASEGRQIEVVVADIKSPFSEVSAGFTEMALESRGVELKSRGSLTINENAALLLKALHKDGDRSWGKWILLLEKGSGTLVVNGIFKSGDDRAARDVEAMLKSVAVMDATRPAPVSADM